MSIDVKSLVLTDMFIISHNTYYAIYASLA